MPLSFEKICTSLTGGLVIIGSSTLTVGRSLPDSFAATFLSTFGGTVLGCGAPLLFFTTVYIFYKKRKEEQREVYGHQNNQRTEPNIYSVSPMLPVSPESPGLNV